MASSCDCDELCRFCAFVTAFREAADEVLAEAAGEAQDD